LVHSYEPESRMLALCSALLTGTKGNALVRDDGYVLSGSELIVKALRMGVRAY